MSDIKSDTDSATDKPRYRILSATDFSEDSRAALVWACQLTEVRESELFLLHVVHDPATSPGFYRSQADDFMQPMQEVAEKMLAQFLEDTAARHPELACMDKIQIRMVSGLPPTRIVEVAELLQADLIAVGSTGTTQLPKRLRGTTRERVVELAKIPVVVVRAKDTGEPSKKEQKRLEKQIRKDRKRLKKMLKVETNEQAEGAEDG